MLLRKFLPLLIILAMFAGACAPTLTETRESYVKAHPNLDPRIKEAIEKGEAVPGMTQEEVKASCGAPNLVSSGKEAGKYCDYWGYKRFTVTFGPEGKVIDVKP